MRIPILIKGIRKVKSEVFSARGFKDSKPTLKRNRSRPKRFFLTDKVQEVFTKLHAVALVDRSAQGRDILFGGPVRPHHPDERLTVFFVRLQIFNAVSLDARDVPRSVLNKKPLRSGEIPFPRQFVRDLLIEFRMRGEHAKHFRTQFPGSPFKKHQFHGRILFDKFEKFLDIFFRAVIPVRGLDMNEGGGLWVPHQSLGHLAQFSRNPQNLSRKDRNFTGRGHTRPRECARIPDKSCHGKSDKRDKRDYRFTSFPGETGRKHRVILHSLIFPFLIEF
ncbi:MAG: hypothetical protein BWY44_01006 [Candidatus Omnitrophica bacterium ADurb.Bin292]|nr:MAG: hypothetical protein BWY44_01006 [Candidatus Omnitrophica bacterium ADurb.Bin292]